MNGGFVRQEFHSSLPLQTHPDLRFKPSTRVENACATGSAAIHMGLNTLAAKKARFVLVVGVEKMTELNSRAGRRGADQGLLRRRGGQHRGGFRRHLRQDHLGLFPALRRQVGRARQDRGQGAQERRQEPYAHFQKEFAYEFCRTPSDKNPFVAGPLKRTDCSPVTDGAAAVVLADVGTALGMKQAIAFRAPQHVNDFLPMSKRDIIKFEGPALAWKQALAEARLDLLDLSFVESHDCFTSAELIEYEAMGLTAPGEGERAIHEGWVERDGKLPVNVSGGLKAKGHPVGATGVSMHVMTAMQLHGSAPGGLQLPNAKVGGVFNMGGAAVANYVSILEPLR